MAAKDTYRGINKPPEHVVNNTRYLIEVSLKIFLLKIVETFLNDKPG
jgi:hypothetical protein